MSGTFPDLNLQTLKVCMDNVGIPVTTEDLQKPTPQRMMEIYEAFLVLLQDVRADQFTQLPFDVLEMLEHPEVHRDSLGLLAFYRHMHKFTHSLGIFQFSLCDILTPQKDRVRHILSGFINFCMFREMRLEIFTGLVAESDKLSEEKRSLELRNAELIESIRQIKAKRAKEQPEVDRLRAANSKLRTSLQEYQTSNADLGTRIDKLKKEKNTITEQQENNLLLLSTLKQDYVRLESRVVQSPDQLRKVIADLTESVRADKQLVVATERQGFELGLRVELMCAAELDILACQRIMLECEAVKKKALECDAKLSSDLEQIARTEAQLREMDINEKMDLTEEDQLNLAIAASLGNDQQPAAASSVPAIPDEKDPAYLPYLFNSIDSEGHAEFDGPAAETARIQFRFKDGSRVVRKFNKAATVRSIFETIKAVKPDLGMFDLLLLRESMLRRLDATIADAKLANASLNVEGIDV
eukprot:jgi/Hompol1/6189/HPOL_004099-RA